VLSLQHLHLHQRPQLLPLPPPLRLLPLLLHHLRLNHLLDELEVALLLALMLANSLKLQVLISLLLQAPGLMGELSLQMLLNINQLFEQPLFLMLAAFALPLLHPLLLNSQRPPLARFLMLDLDSRISLTAPCAV
jgi:hypothetical protein